MIHPDKWKESPEILQRIRFKNQDNIVVILKRIKETKSVTLVYAAKNEECKKGKLVLKAVRLVTMTLLPSTYRIQYLMARRVTIRQ